MTRHAYLIIAHNEYTVLETLLSMLDDRRNDIFLHIDRRADELYRQVSGITMNHARLHLLSDRINVYWGDISQVKVEYLLFETAHRNHHYDYYHLLSGVDLPLKSQDYIHRFFAENAGKEFVGYWNDASHIRDLDRKVSRYYFFLRYYKDRKHPLHGLTSFCRNMALAVQKLFHLRRKADYEFKKGFQWLSITDAFCSYLIQQKPAVMKRFRHTLCPDEIFLHTVLWNSPFRKNIYCHDDPQKGSMRLIDWQRGNPYVWQDSDFDELMSSDALFARKFSSSGNTPIHRISDSLSPNLTERNRMKTH